MTANTKTIIEEEQSICSLCGGRGQEHNPAMTSGMSMCRQCQGSGYIITKRTTRTEIINS